ncbi:MAG: DUF2058 domain-containing protein [Steroidobacteraceae bacterium]
MSLSLRDQLIQAGFVSSKQAKQAEQQKRQQARRPQNAPPKSTPPAAAAKAARDKDLNRQRQQQREHGARLAEIRQIVEQNRLPVVASEDYFNFVHKNKVRRIAVDAGLRERITGGTLFIVRYGKFYALVTPEIAARVRERNVDSIVNLDAPPAAPGAENDPYAQFKVPDDLYW